MIGLISFCLEAQRPWWSQSSFFVRQKWISLTITLAAIVAVDVISNGIVRALYRPLFDLTEMLNK